MAAGLALTVLSGCNSGIPLFVKYASGSRYVLLADARYNRCHIHDVRAGRTRSFDGNFACEDPPQRRWIIEPAPLALDRRLRLVSIDQEGALSVRSLPRLPDMHSPWAIHVAFGPANDQISLILCRESISSDPNWRAFRMKIGDDNWRRIDSKPQRTALRRYVRQRPEHSMGPGDCIAASPFTFKTKGSGRRFGGAQGEKVERVKETRDAGGQHYEYRLPSPDGKTFVSIRVEQPQLAWAQGWGVVKITDKETGRKRVLMSNTDLLLRIWHKCIYGPFGSVIGALVIKV